MWPEIRQLCDICQTEFVSSSARPHRQAASRTETGSRPTWPQVNRKCQHILRDSIPLELIDGRGESRRCCFQLAAHLLRSPGRAGQSRVSIHFLRLARGSRRPWRRRPTSKLRASGRRATLARSCQVREFRFHFWRIFGQIRHNLFICVNFTGHVRLSFLQKAGHHQRALAWPGASRLVSSRLVCLRHSGPPGSHNLTDKMRGAARSLTWPFAWPRNGAATHSYRAPRSSLLLSLLLLLLFRVCWGQFGAGDLRAQ